VELAGAIDTDHELPQGSYSEYYGMYARVVCSHCEALLYGANVKYGSETPEAHDSNCPVLKAKAVLERVKGDG
jgi:hypothetical protein